MQRDSKGRFMKKEQKQIIHGFKGFDKNLQCRGFQFAEGETYKYNGEAIACQSGFHFCENPLNVFHYYPPAKSRFAVVEGGGQTDKHADDSKVSCTELKIKTEITMKDIIEAGIKFTFSSVKWSKSNTSNGDFSGATSNGDFSGATSNGYSSGATSNGDSSGATSNGNYSGATSNGYYSGATSNGYYSGATSNGNYSGATSNGDYSGATSNGDFSGATSNGYYTTSSAKGILSPAVCAGLYGKAKAGTYSCIAIGWNNKKENRKEMRCAEIGCGDGSDGKLKSDTWYKLDDNGNFIEVN